MKTSSWNPHRRDVLRTLGGGLLVPAAAALPSRARAADPISLNVWQWIPDFDVQVDLFNKAMELQPDLKEQIQSIASEQKGAPAVKKP